MDTLEADRVVGFQRTPDEHRKGNLNARGWRRPEVLERLQERVLVTFLRWLAAAAIASAALMLVQVAQRDALGPGVLAIVAWVALGGCLLPLRHWLGNQRTALATILHLGLLCAYMKCLRGLTPGVALTDAAVVLLAGLFFGKRSALMVLGACLLSLLGAAVVATQGWSSSWSVQLWDDPQDPLVWTRHAVSLVFLGGALAMNFTQLIESLQATVTSLTDTLEREHAERAQRRAVENELERARRMEAIAQVASGLAHDFNNNLMLMMSAAESIEKDERCPADVRTLAVDVLSAVEASAEIVTEMMNLGRAPEKLRRSIPAAAAAERCRRSLRRSLPSGIELNLQGDTQARVPVSEGAFLQCLTNLVLNARDAVGEEGRIRIRVAERRTDSIPPGWHAGAGDFVVVSVEDNGDGMDDETIQHAFDPFFTTKESGKGTGLGLAMVRKIVYDAHGFVVLRSAQGRGTTFDLHFPVCQETAQAS